MTIHLPGRAAPAPELPSELSRILADQAERDAAEVALHARNKEVLFDGLRLVGIAHVLVSFDGSGDSGQIENIEARSDADQSVTLPAAQITFAGIDWQSGAPTERRLTLEGAVEELVYDLLSDTHSGWQDNDGAYGELLLANYLGRVTKSRILEAVREGVGESAAQLIDHLKKGDMAREAERLLDGSGWLPEPLRMEDLEAEVADAADGVSDELPAFLTADDDPQAEEEDEQQHLIAAE